MISMKFKAAYLAFFGIAYALPVCAYDAETHGLIMFKAYSASALAQTGAGSIVARLGLDRLDVPTPFNAYWLSAPSTAAYYDNTSSFDVNTYTRQSNEFERCQMQHLAPPPTSSGFNWLAGDPMLSGGVVTFFPIQNWLMRGDLREDDLTPFLYSSFAKDRCGQPDLDPYGPAVRVLNHFYDPVHDVPLSAGVACGSAPTGSCLKSVDWGLGFIDSFATPPVVDTSRRNHFSYADARENFWRALTGERGRSTPPYIAAARQADSQERLYRWATAFKSLGDAIHLLQDGASPQHVRNDPHSGLNSQERQAFEGYTNARVLQDQSLVGAYVRTFFQYGRPASLPDIVIGNYPAVSFATPIRFYTTRLKGDSATVSPSGRYGMMDYANRGFFTGGTHPNSSAGQSFLSPATTIDAAHGYTQSTAPCSLSSSIGNVGKAGLSCTHWMHAVPDPVSPSYVDTLPNANYTAPPLISESAFRFLLSSGSPTIVPQYAIGVDELIDIGNLTIPRAVGYSAGMINYFFRGQLTVSAPPSGLFGVIDQGTPHTVDADGYPRNTNNTIFGFTTLRARVKNTTADIHESGSGTVVPQTAKTGQLVAIARYHRNPCYRPDLSGEYVKKPDGSLVVPAGCSLAQTRTAYQEISVSAPIAIDASGNFPGTNNGTNACGNVGNLTTGPSGSCANTAGVLGEFDFSADPIPANATDLFLQLAYRGGLGQETDGIAVGTIDLLEPNYYTVWNNSDWYLYNDQWTLPANVPASYDPNPIPITDSAYCWQDQLIFSFATHDVVGSGQFYRIGVLSDLAPHQVGDVTNFYNQFFSGLGSAFVGSVRQSDKENGGTFTTQPMVYARGTTLGTIGWFDYYKFWPDDPYSSAITVAMFNLQPTIGNPGALGRPVAGIAHYSSSPSSLCSGSLLEATPTDAASAARRGGIDPAH